MKIWLPHVKCNSGVDVYIEVLARGIEKAGHQAQITPYAHCWQYFPWRMGSAVVPLGADIILANSWNGFVFRSLPARLVIVEHHCVFDPLYQPYRSLAQRVFHDQVVRRFERASLRAADAVVSVSGYTAKALQQTFGGPMAEVIHNGIDVDYFAPDPTAKSPLKHRPVRLLFVGNPTVRKGADLLGPIMRTLGTGYELFYTSGRRGNDELAQLPNVKALGRLSNDELRDAYRKADILLFPSRLEGFGYAAVEAMACGTPVIATNGSSLPEVVDNGVTGVLCEPNDVGSFVSAVRSIAEDPTRLEFMGKQSRERAKRLFTLEGMIRRYIKLFDRLLND